MDIHTLAPSSSLRLASAPASDVSVAGDASATLRWDGDTLNLETDGPVVVNGKPSRGQTVLAQGDEFALGDVHVAIGISSHSLSASRRALTHDEFRHRVWEELARALRVGRPTSLVMLRARQGEGRALANAALHLMRAGDLIGNYAPDELELLLPDTERARAVQVVDRLLQRADLQARTGIAVGTKDGQNADRLIYAARCALRRSKRKSASVPPAPARHVSRRLEPVSSDPVTQALLASLEGPAQTDSPIMLHGEPNAGKGVFARWIHQQSSRSSGPFVVIRCASIDSLDAAWHAFGDGRDAEPSLLANARAGTVFFDEIGDLRPPDHPILTGRLRDEVGKIRILSSTHRALTALVERRAFDSQLAELLQGHDTEVAPLRNRPADILPLARSYAEEYAEGDPPLLSAGAVARLYSYPWPGNVLELRNALERAVRLAGQRSILAEHLPSEPLPATSLDGALKVHVDSVERDAITKALADCNHNQTHAAKRLGISRRSLIYKMEKYGLKRPPRGQTTTARPTSVGP